MATAIQCANDLLENKEFSQFLSDSEVKEMLKDISGRIDSFEEANLPTFQKEALKEQRLKDFEEGIKRTVKKRTFEKIDAKIKASRNTTHAVTGAKTSDDVKDNINNLMRLTDGRKEAFAADMFSSLESKMLNHKDPEVSKLSYSMFKRLSDPLIETKNKKIFRDKMTRAMFKLQKGEDIGVVYSSVKERQAVENIFKALTETQKKVFLRKKNAGIIQGFQDNFIWSRRYDVREIDALGEQGWRDLMRDNLDPKDIQQEFLGADGKPTDEFLDTLRESIVNSDGGSVVDPRNNDNFSSFIKARTKSRVLNFKSGDAEFEVFSRIAKEKNMRSLIGADLNDSAVMVSNAEVFGVNSKDSFGETLDNAANFIKQRKLKRRKKSKIFTQDTAREDFSKFKKSKATKDFLALTTSPTTNYGPFSKFLFVSRNLNLLKLGATAISTAPYDAITTAMTTMADKGVQKSFSLFHKQAGRFAQVARQIVDPKKKAELAKALGIYSGIHDVSSISRMSGDVLAAQSKSSKAVKFSTNLGGQFTKWSGLNFQTEASLFNSALENANTLSAVIKGAKKNQLTPILEDTLKRTGLTTREVDILAQNIDKVSGIEGLWDDPNAFLNAQKIYDLDDRVFAGSVGLAKRRKDELHSKLKAFINVGARKGTPTPGRLDNPFAGQNNVGGMEAMFQFAFTFKNTIFKMTNDFVANTSRMNRNLTVGQRAEAYTAMGIGAVGTFLAVDTLSSLILDKEPAWQKAARGDLEGVMINFAEKTSLAPMFTDPLVRTFESRNRWGQSGLIDFFTGPGGSMLRDAENILSSRDKMEASYNFMQNHLFPTSNWMLRGAGRHVFGYDVRTNRYIGGEEPGRQRQSDREFIPGSVSDIFK